MNGYLKQDSLIAWAEKDQKRIDWLIENGYVEKIEPEIFYKRGDIFRHTETKDKAMLVTVGKSKAHLAMVSGGYTGKTWTGTDTEISDPEKITEKELDGISGIRGVKGWEKIS